MNDEPAYETLANDGVICAAHPGIICSVLLVPTDQNQQLWRAHFTGNQLPALPLSVVDGADATRGEGERGLRGKWLIVTRDSGGCEATCEQKLFAMRQSRLIVGREMDRVVRVVLIEDDTRPSSELVKRYQGTAWVAAKSSPWLSSLPIPAQDASNGRAFFYAVDPLGNVFMRYGADADTKLIAKDLRQVLKASQIG